MRRMDLIDMGKAPAFMGAKVALSSLYEGQLAGVDRGVAVCDGRYVVVRDEITAGDSAAVVRWSMFTPAAVRIVGADRAELMLHGKRLSMVVSGTAPVEMKTWDTDPPPHDYDTPNPGTAAVGFEVRLPAGDRASFNVFLVPDGVSVEPVKSLALWK